jgi:hypothetical protein
VPKRSRNASVVQETSAYRINRKSASSESRAFDGNQYGLKFPLFEHYGVPLWVPEVGGPIDLVMSVFGGMRARGSGTGSRSASRPPGRPGQGRGPLARRAPPYGYLIAGAGPHPNPAKAADGKRLHKLVLDPEARPWWRARPGSGQAGSIGQMKPS